MYKFDGARNQKVWELDNVIYETHRRVDWSDETIRSLVITKSIHSARTYEGRIDCEDHSPDAGPFELGWRAKATKNGYKIAPTDTSGNLSSQLVDDSFTHSPDFDRKLRIYIGEEISKFESNKRRKVA